MPYLEPLDKVQIGVEAAYGDAAAGTIQLPGVESPSITPHVDAEQLVDKRGNTMPAHEAVITRRWCEGVLDGYLTYEYAYLWLDAMLGKATPAAGVRTYFASLDWAAETEQSLSLRYGQADLIYVAGGVLPTNLRIAGGSGEAVKYSFAFFGQSASDGASFASLSYPAVVYAMGSHCSLSLDAGLTSAPGTTALADTAFRFEYNITNNRRGLWHLGDTEPSGWRNGRWGGTAKLSLEANATTLGYLGDILDATVQPEGYVARISMTDGTRQLDLDVSGHAITPPMLVTDDDGIVTVELDLAPAYGSHANFESCWGAELTLPV